MFKDKELGCLGKSLLALLMIFIIARGSVFIESAIKSISSTPTVKTTATSTPRQTVRPTVHPTVHPTTNPSPSPAPEYESLSVGASGAAVLKLQSRLNELGFSVGTADGSYGAKTEHAVKEFQKASGLTADGIAGKKTQTALYASSAPKAPASYHTYSASSSNGASVSGGSGGNASNLNKYNEEVTSAYVGNSNTGKFHRSSCSSAKKISPSNRVSFSSRDAAISAGYDSCKQCKP